MLKSSHLHLQSRDPYNFLVNVTHDSKITRLICPSYSPALNGRTATFFALPAMSGMYQYVLFALMIAE